MPNNLFADIKRVGGKWHAVKCDCAGNKCVSIFVRTCPHRLARRGPVIAEACDVCRGQQWFFKGACITCWPPEKECMFHE